MKSQGSCQDQDIWTYVIYTPVEYFSLISLVLGEVQIGLDFSSFKLLFLPTSLHLNFLKANKSSTVFAPIASIASIASIYFYNHLQDLNLSSSQSKWLSLLRELPPRPRRQGGAPGSSGLTSSWLAVAGLPRLSYVAGY